MAMRIIGAMIIIVALALPSFIVAVVFGADSVAAAFGGAMVIAALTAVVVGLIMVGIDLVMG